MTSASFEDNFLTLSLSAFRRSILIYCGQNRLVGLCVNLGGDGKLGGGVPVLLSLRCGGFPVEFCFSRFLKYTRRCIKYLSPDLVTVSAGSKIDGQSEEATRKHFVRLFLGKRECRLPYSSLCKQ